MRSPAKHLPLLTLLTLLTIRTQLGALLIHSRLGWKLGTPRSHRLGAAAFVFYGSDALRVVPKATLFQWGQSRLGEAQAAKGAENGQYVGIDSK